MKLLILLVATAALSACQVQPQIVEGVSLGMDQIRGDAELVLCRGITVGAWVRAYGQDPKKAAAWRELCSVQVQETP